MESVMPPTDESCDANAAEQGYAVQVTDPHGQEHELLLSFELDDHGERESLTVLLDYTKGPRHGEASNPLVKWIASREHPNDNCTGAADIGDGERRLPVEWRGSGIGTLLQTCLTCWAKEIEPPVPIVEIFFSPSDVTNGDREIDADALNRREKFWRNFGFEFQLDEDRTSGKSNPMMSNKLETPKLRESNDRGWTLKLSNDLKELLDTTGHTPKHASLQAD